jgi:hypothetical protein
VEELAQFAREQKEVRLANNRKGFCRMARVEGNPKCKLGFYSCRAVVFSDGKWVVVQGMVLLEEMSKEGFVQENYYSFKGRFGCKCKGTTVHLCLCFSLLFCIQTCLHAGSFSLPLPSACISLSLSCTWRRNWLIFTPVWFKAQIVVLIAENSLAHGGEPG